MNIQTLIKTHQHTIMTVAIVLAISLLGYGLYGAIGMAMFWFGREHAQAEYRYMSLMKINRSELGFFDVFKKDAWNYDSLVNDLIIPSIIGLSIGVILW